MLDRTLIKEKMIVTVKIIIYSVGYWKVCHIV